MFCPLCRAEFRDGFSRCESCDADLVEEENLPPEEISEDLSPFISENPDSENEQKWAQMGKCPSNAILVFESADPLLLRSIGNLFHENDLPFFIRNGELRNSFPSAIFGGMGPQVVDPTCFLVLPQHEAEAKALLEDFKLNPPVYDQDLLDLPPELAQATDEPDPDSEDESLDEIPDLSEKKKTLFCPNCGAKLTITAGDFLSGKHPCRACGKTIDLD